MKSDLATIYGVEATDVSLEARYETTGTLAVTIPGGLSEAAALSALAVTNSHTLAGVRCLLA